MLKLTTEELFSGDVAPSAAKEEMSWCSAAAPFKGVKQNKYSVQTSTSPVLDLAWPALKSMTWNICSLLQQLFEKQTIVAGVNKYSRSLTRKQARPGPVQGLYWPGLNICFA